jgi:hypothetical protein
MTRSRSFVWPVVCIAAASALLIGAMPPVPPDAGHVAFVRQAVPKLLGRKPRGAEEVKLLADLAEAAGREAMLRALMEEPEFIEHWTDIVLRVLRVQRDYTSTTKALPDCFRDPMRKVPASGALARHVRDEPVSSPEAAGPFNMIDLIQSALVLDDLAAVFRAYPVALRAQLLPEAGSATDPIDKDALGKRFTQNLLSRNLSCLGCHNPEFSRSHLEGQMGPSVWPRTYPIPYALEKAVFGSSYGGEGLNASPIFRDDQFDPAAPGPWGLSGCGTLLASLAALPPAEAASLAGVSGDRIGMADLAQTFKAGAASLAERGPQLTPWPGGGPSEIPAEQALAYLTAVTAVDKVWEEVMGARLTIVHTFSRNGPQRDALKDLVEQSFLKSWSLKTLLARIMTSDYFNRRSPDLGGGDTAYQLPMLFDPWVAHDPRSGPPPNDPSVLNNGQGEIVHRSNPRGLLYAISAALGWPPPPRLLADFAQDFPSYDLVAASGQYISETRQGRKGVDFQGLLVWESQLGLCNPPSQDNVPQSDWIDRVLLKIEETNAADPSHPLTVGDVAASVKDWLVADASIADAAPSPPPAGGPLPSERDAVAALFGVARLDVPASSVAELGNRLRAYCGVLLKTPQFLLTGIDAGGGSLTFPRLRVCNDKRCSYGDMCAGYAATLARAGRTIECNAANRTLRQVGVARAPDAGRTDAARSGWAEFEALSKKIGSGLMSTAKPRDVPEGTSGGHRGEVAPLSDEEAEARLRAYRSSKAFEREHQHLKKKP